MSETPKEHISHSAYSRQKRVREIGVITLGFVMLPLMQGIVTPPELGISHNAATPASILGFGWDLVLLVFLIGSGMPHLLRIKEYWQWNWVTTLRGLALGVLLLGLASIPGSFLPVHGDSAVPFAVPKAAYQWILIGITLTLAVLLEELLYRVYFLERLASLGADPRVAIVVSVPLFAIGHSYQGITGIVLAAIAGTVLALAWLRWKSYWTNCLGHLIYNATVLAATFLYQ